MGYLASNNGFSTLAASLTNVATTLTVQTGQGDRFPVIAGSDYTFVTLEDSSSNIEIVKITARASGSDVPTIVRAQEGTTARAWNVGDIVECRPTAAVINGKAEVAGSSTQAFAMATAAQGTSTTQGASTAFVIGEANKHKNIIINGGFTVNQRAYVSAATLAAGAYGHDRWKAGSGGGDYSFTQLASNTTITIAANKTLIQVVENKNVQAASYVLSWTGTALARYAVNSATPAGAYAASPILITGQTVGTTLSVEFGNGASAGTLGNVQLEIGSCATGFDYRPYTQELILCQRYYEICGSGSAGKAVSATGIQGSFIFKVPKRAAPTMSLFAQGSIVEYGVATRAGSGGTLSVNGAPVATGGGYFDLSGFSSMTAGNFVSIMNDPFAAAAEL